jgi:type VI secretion system secreted protein VgrG
VSARSIVAEVECAALRAPLRLARLAGVEAMNALPSWEASLVGDEPLASLENLVGADATVRLEDELEGALRTIPLVVSQACLESLPGVVTHATLRLEPALSRLGHRSGYRVLRDKTAPEIVEAVLAEAPGSSLARAWRLAGRYERRPICVSYGEVEWAFVERLLAEEGIAYWLDDAAGVAFADHGAAHEPIDGDPVVLFEEADGAVRGRRLDRAERRSELAFTAVHVRDDDVRAATGHVEGRAGSGAFERFEYPAGVRTPDAAAGRAEVRLEQLGRSSRRLVVEGDTTRLRPGRLARIEGAGVPMDGEHLVVEVRHELALGTRLDSAPARYRCRAVLVPHEGRTFRPAVPEAPAFAPGVEPAVTTGPAAEEIHVDDLARVKVRFLWDRSGVSDDRSSHWVRTVQPNLGGSMLLPRVGWEVPIAFACGDPDRPIGLGRHYNATAITPYPLPSSLATTTLQSATSPGGGATNELRMGDAAGGEEMFLHASRDQTASAGGDATTTVAGDQTHDVGLALLVGVRGAQSAQIAGEQKVDVLGNCGVTVRGARSVSVGGMEAIDVGGDRSVAAGTYTELVGALHATECNQANASVDAAFLQVAGGAMALAGGMGVSETVVSARTEIVLGSKSVVAARGVSESVVGPKTLTAGATSETAGTKIVTAVTAGGAVSVGGSATIRAGGTLSIEAANIVVVAATLDAGSLRMSGGAVHIEGSQSKFEGSIKRPGGARLED